MPISTICAPSIYRDGRYPFQYIIWLSCCFSYWRMLSALTDAGPRVGFMAFVMRLANISPHCSICSPRLCRIWFCATEEGGLTRRPSTQPLLRNLFLWSLRFGLSWVLHAATLYVPNVATVLGLYTGPLLPSNAMSKTPVFRFTLLQTPNHSLLNYWWILTEGTLKVVEQLLSLSYKDLSLLKRPLRLFVPILYITLLY